MQDNLSHIIGTERMMQGDPTPDNQPARTDHVANPIGEMNEHWVEHYRDLPGAEVLEIFRQLSAQRLTELSALPPAAFDEIGPTPVGQAPFRTFLAVRVMDSWIHEQDMRRALDRPGHLARPRRRPLGGPPGRRHAVRGGQAGGAPDGTSVVFDIGRPASPADGIEADSLVVAVVVDGRAGPGRRRAHRTHRRGGARSGHLRGPDQRPAGSGVRRSTSDQVRLSGDVELGRSVVEHLSFMS